MWHVYLSSIVLSLACAAVADDLFILPTAPGPSNNFVANLVWSIGSVQDIQWTTTLKSYYIALFQQNTNPPSGNQIETIYTASGNGAGNQNFKWQVQTYDSNLTFSNVYFLWINPGSSAGFTSHYFNITNEQAASSSSSSTSSSTSSPSSSVTSTTSVVTTTTSTPPSSSTSVAAANPTSDSNSSVLKVGLGVGLGLGLPLVLIAGIWIGLKAVKQRKSSSLSVDSSLPLGHFSNQKTYSRPPFYTDEPVYKGHEVYEAPATQLSPAELG